MRKIYSFLIALLAVCGVAQAQVTFDFSTDDAYTLFGLSGFSSTPTGQPAVTDGDITADVSTTSSDVTITVSPSGGKNANRMWSGSLRLYGGTLTVASSGKNITAIKFVLNSSKWGDSNTANTGTLEKGSWSGNAASVVITIAGNTQIKSMSVTLDGADPTPVDPTPTIDWTSSMDAPLTVASALEKAGKLEAKAESDKEVYVKGIVSRITEIGTVNQQTGEAYGNVTYYISDDGTEANELYIFRGFGLGGEKITSAEGLKKGDNVIVLGKIKNYIEKDGSSTLEMTQGNQMVKLNDQTVDPTPTPTPGDTKTIAEIIAAGDAASATTSATVMAVAKTGFLLGDASGYMYVYTGSEPTVAVGDVVTVSGKVSTYGGCKQFSEVKVEKTGTTEVTYPTAEELTASSFDALVKSPVVKYVTVAGELSISGNYYNIKIEGATAQGSILATADVLSSLGNGTTVTVTGFFVYQTSSGKYGNIIVTSIEAPEVEYTEMASIAAAKAAATDEQAPVQLNVTDMLVTYVNGQSLYLFDGTDGILVYGTNKDLKAGDKISGSIKGQLYVRYGSTQLSSPVYDVTVTSSDNEVVPQEITADVLVANIKDYENELVKLTQMLPTAEAWESQNVTFKYRDKQRQYHEVVLRDNWKIATTMTFNTETQYELTGFPVKYINKDNSEVIQLYPRSMADIDNGEEPVVYVFTGDGSLEKPYTVEDMQHIVATSTSEAVETGKWVKGFIAGYINGSSLSEKTAMFSADAPEGTDKDGNPLTVTVSNILLADAAGANTVAAIIPIALQNNTPARTDLNLKDNASKFGTQVWLKGDIFKYMGVTGLKNVKDYSLDGVITTGVRSLDAAAPARDIFNLAGQRVQNLNKRGLYIVNGKKVVVK